jgi:hypothetical protein
VAAPASAQATTTLSGTVTFNGKPAVGANVTATSATANFRTLTDAKGVFAFAAIPPGSYNVVAQSAAGSSSLKLDVRATGADITLALDTIKQIGRTSVVARPPVRGGGTDVAVSTAQIEHAATSDSLPDLLVQLPGAARGANGAVHFNGDHGNINYIVDGVQIPQALNRSVGGEFDSSDIGSVDVLQGAYPAQYGERFASVVNISSRNITGPAGFTGELTGGSYGSLDSTVTYHAPVGKGALDVAIRNERTDHQLDPPNFDSPHDSGSNTNQFMRLAIPRGNNFFDLTISHSFQTFQIPNDVALGQPAQTNDNETQEDLFGALQFRHAIGDHGSLSFGPSFKRSRIRDFGDPLNDFAFGIAGNPGAPTDCANALSPGSTFANPQPNPAVAFSNLSCGFSLFGDRTARDYGFNADYELRSTNHTVRAGGIMNATFVQKDYDITLQPGNFLAPILTPLTPNAAFTVEDTAPNVSHSVALYVQDTWLMGAYRLDYGVRGNSFKVFSTEFSDGFAQVSPRLKLTRSFGTRSSVYVYYGRFFTPFSLENVSPTAAFALNLPLQSSIAAFDLRPQRDSVYEVGGHFALGRGDVGVRVMQKNATDLIDDTQVGTTNLHQDINFAQGRIAVQTAYYQLSLPRASRLYASLTHTYAVGKGCETQLLAPCFGAPNDWTPADHDQRWEATTGLTQNDRHGGWFGIDGEYGSGLSSTYCMPANDNCKVPPHITFDATKGIPMHGNMSLTLRVGNILNDRYLVTFDNAQGNHYASPRTFQVGLRFGNPHS